jgi:hypothetical protein
MPDISYKFQELVFTKGNAKAVPVTGREGP